MKKYVALLLFALIGSSCFFGETSKAMEHNDKSDVSITFVGTDKETLPPPGTKDPFEPQHTFPDVIPSHVGSLPSTGELVTSVIWLLLGLSLFIVCLSVFSFKKIIGQTVWE